MPFGQRSISQVPVAIDSGNSTSNYLSFGTVTAINAVQNAPLTVEAWFYVTLGASSATQIGLLGNDGATQGFDFETNSDGILHLWNDSQGAYVDSGLPAFQTGVWTYEAFSFDGSTTWTSYYGTERGDLKQTGTFSKAGITSNASAFTLGGAHGYTLPWNGATALFRFWKGRPLTLSDIQRSWRQHLPAGAGVPGLVFHYDAYQSPTTDLVAGIVGTATGTVNCVGRGPKLFRIVPNDALSVASVPSGVVALPPGGFTVRQAVKRASIW